MLQFIDAKQINTVCTENDIKTFGIPISSDTKTSSLADLFFLKYPNIKEKFEQAAETEILDGGSVFKVSTDDITAYFYVAKLTDKFQGYLLDIVNGISKIATQTNPNKIMILLLTSDESKLTDSIVLNALANNISMCSNDVYIATVADYKKYISAITDGIVYCKQDSWESNWMLSDDDIKFTDILVSAMGNAPGVKLTKAGLVKAYLIAHQNGMYPKLEFYDTEYGKFFKLFFVKVNTLVNHGIMTNTFFRSTDGGNKIHLTVGPTYSLIKQLAYTKLTKERASITSISTKIAEELAKSFKPRTDNRYNQPNPQDNTNLFNL